MGVTPPVATPRMATSFALAARPLPRLARVAAIPPRRVARVAARCRASEPPDAVRVTRARPTARTVALVASSACASASAAPAHALSDAWFGWYFAPGGFALGPALFLTAFLLGQAIFEKVTGTGPTSKGKSKSDDG